MKQVQTNKPAYKQPPIYFTSPSFLYSISLVLLLLDFPNKMSSSDSVSTVTEIESALHLDSPPLPRRLNLVFVVNKKKYEIPVPLENSFNEQVVKEIIIGLQHGIAENLLPQLIVEIKDHTNEDIIERTANLFDQRPYEIAPPKPVLVVEAIRWNKDNMRTTNKGLLAQYRNKHLTLKKLHMASSPKAWKRIELDYQNNPESILGWYAYLDPLNITKRPEHLIVLLESISDLRSQRSEVLLKKAQIIESIKQAHRQNLGDSLFLRSALTDIQIKLRNIKRKNAQSIKDVEEVIEQSHSDIVRQIITLKQFLQNDPTDPYNQDIDYILDGLRDENHPETFIPNLGPHYNPEKDTYDTTIKYDKGERRKIIKQFQEDFEEEMKNNVEVVLGGTRIEHAMEKANWAGIFFTTWIEQTQVGQRPNNVDLELIIKCYRAYDKLIGIDTPIANAIKKYSILFASNEYWLDIEFMGKKYMQHMKFKNDQQTSMHIPSVPIAVAKQTNNTTTDTSGSSMSLAETKQDKE